MYSTKQREFQVCDSSAVQAKVDAQPEPAVVLFPDGPATIESYTIAYGKDGASYAVVVGRLDATGQRFFANTQEGDETTLQTLIDKDPLGEPVFVRSLVSAIELHFPKSGSTNCSRSSHRMAR